MTLVERIKFEGKKMGLTLSTIEKKSGLGNGTIRRWDERSPSCENLSNVAKLLCVSMDYLYTGNKEYNNLSDEEQEYIQLFSILSNEDKKICLKIIKGLNALDKM